MADLCVSERSSRQATDPGISSDYLYARRVEAGQIDSGIATADVGIAGTLYIAEWDDDGT